MKFSEISNHLWAAWTQWHVVFPCWNDPSFLAIYEIHELAQCSGYWTFLVGPSLICEYTPNHYETITSIDIVFLTTGFHNLMGVCTMSALFNYHETTETMTHRTTWCVTKLAGFSVPRFHESYRTPTRFPELNVGLISSIITCPLL